MDTQLLEIGKYGRSGIKLKGISQDSLMQVYYGRIENIKGYLQLIEEYKWYVENGFDRYIKIVDAQGEFTVNWDGVN